MPKQHIYGDSAMFAFMVLFTGAIVRIGASIYLPAMPEISEAMHISKAMMSNTLSVYFVVFALFTLVSGMLSDAYGRRHILLAGMALFSLGAAVCAVSESYEMLMTGRVIQALGASMVPGTLMAMIRDACDDMRVVSLMGWLTVLSGLFLVAAPIIGGVLTHFFGWSANFWFLVFFTLAVLGLGIFRMHETHPLHARVPFAPRETLKYTAAMLKSPAFMLVLSPVVTFYAVQGAFLASAPFILMEQYGLSPVLFGISNLNIVIGLFSGRYLGMFILKHHTPQKLYRYATLLSVGVALLFAGIAVGWFSGLWAFLIIAGIFALLFGMVAPLGMKSSLTAFRTVSGMAAAVQTSTLFAASAAGSALTGAMIHTFSSTLDVEAVFALVCLLLCLLAAIGTTKAQKVLAADIPPDSAICLKKEAD